jgi:threonine synthase
MTTSLATVSLGTAACLRCRECGGEYPLAPVPACEQCFGPLEIGYDDAARRRVTRESVAAGPADIWRYQALLPAVEPRWRADMGVGCTRLVPAPNLAGALGMRRLWVKDDSRNPTHSFKDRVVAVAASVARAFGMRVLACASTGNLGNAVAAAAARCGLHSVVFVPDGLEAGKLVPTSVYGAHLIAVRGSYDDVNRLCSEVSGEEPWAFVNVNFRAFYAEGSKTVGFEIAEQLGWRLPQQVVIPVASGSLLTKVDRAFGEFAGLGLVEPSGCRVFGAQPDGCAPVATAFRTGAPTIRPVRPDTIAKSLAIGNPADGLYALDVARRTGGAIESVSDDDVVRGIRLLARTEGIFTETAGGVAVAALRKLLEAGELDPEAETVLVNTGDGLKTLDAVMPTSEAGRIIPASLEAFRELAIELGIGG